MVNMPNITYRSSRLLRATFMQLHRQQEAGIFCDVVLQAEGERIYAHACVLSACSPYFTEQLANVKPANQPAHIDIPRVMPSTLHKLVHYLYTSELEVTREEAVKVLAAARLLRIPELEALQLQGAKLVRPESWPRLNRKCFQASDQTIIEGTAKVMTPLAIRKKPGGPAGEKCKAVAVMEDASTGHSSALAAARKSPAQVGARGGDELHVDSEPSCSPLHTASGGSDKSTSLNSPTPSSCESLGPTPDFSDSPMGAGGQPARRIKLSRLKFGEPLNVPKTLAQGRAGSNTTSAARRTWRQRAVAKETPEECVHVASSETERSSAPCAQEGSVSPLLKTHIIKNPSSVPRCPRTSGARCDTSVNEGSLGQSKLTNGSHRSEDVCEAPPMEDPAQLLICKSTNVLPPASDPEDSMIPTESSESWTHFMFLTDVTEGSENLGECEDQLALLLSLSDAGEPLNEHIASNLEAYDGSESGHAALYPTLDPGGGGEDKGLAIRLTKLLPEQHKVKKAERQNMEVADTVPSLLKGESPSQDGLEPSIAKQENHGSLLAHTYDSPTPRPGEASLQDGVQNATRLKRPMSAEKREVAFSQAKRPCGCPPSSTWKPSRKLLGTVATPDTSPLQGSVSGASKVARLDGEVCKHPVFGEVSSSGNTGNAIKPSDTLQGPLDRLSWADEEEEVDVLNSEGSVAPDTACFFIRPDPSSESDVEVNVVD